MYTEKAIAMVRESIGSTTRNGGPTPQKAPKKKPAKRGGANSDGTVPEVGQDELIGQQYMGDTADASPS